MIIQRSTVRASRGLSMLLLVFGTSKLFAQDVAVHRIDRVDAVAPDVFSLIKGIRELSDGRVIVTDWIEERVVVIDFAASTTQDLGRVGAGPKEFRLPSSLLPLPADSTLLVDIGNTRLTVLGPELRFVRSLSMYAHGERFAMSPRAIDEHGAMYFALSPWAGGPQAGRMDSVPVARWAPGYERIQLVANVQMRVSTPRKRRVSFRFGIPFVMFEKRDSWAIASDGWLAVVRSEPYRVEWYGPNGEHVAGPAIDYEERPVTMDDRRDFIRRWLMSSYTSGRGPDGGIGHIPAENQSTPEINRMARSEEFAEVFPPFEAGGVWTSRDGLLWVRRFLPAGSTSTFDVFDRSGARTAVVKLRAGRRIVGFGSGTLYTTMADDDGLLTLERYRMPALK